METSKKILIICLLITIIGIVISFETPIVIFPVVCFDVIGAICIILELITPKNLRLVYNCS